VAYRHGSWLAEALAGYCTRVNVSMEEDGSIIVADNGEGLEVHGAMEASTLLLNMQQLALPCLQVS
jgi:DNA gyrase/topoisomerase IV subunit B